MNLSLERNYFNLFLFLSILLFTACTKIVTTDIGGGLIPPVDGVNTKEMYLDVVSKNLKDTSAGVGTAGIHALGYVNDPLFGRTTAAINMQVKPNFPFSYPVTNSPDSIFFDSAVLVLSYKGAWGDTLQPLNLKVFEIDKSAPDFKYDTIYSTNYSLPRGNEITYAPKNVTVTSLNDTTPLRIRLSDSYGKSLLYDFDTSNAYKNDTMFNNHFRNKGLQIVPLETGSGLMKIALTDTATKLALYFHYKNAEGKSDTTFSYFTCNINHCGSTNYIKRERSGTQAGEYLARSNNDTAQDLIFIDASPGIFASIKIPRLDTITNKIIHRAELLMTQVPDLINNKDTVYTPPNLFLTAFSSDSGKRFILPNDVTIQFTSGYYSVTNQSRFGCFPFRKDDAVSGRKIYAYSFDMSRYLQGIVTRHEKNYPLILFAPYNEIIEASETSSVAVFSASPSSPLNQPAMGRIRLGGGKHTDYKMRFHIVYSDLPNQ